MYETIFSLIRKYSLRFISSAPGFLAYYLLCAFYQLTLINESRTNVRKSEIRRQYSIRFIYQKNFHEILEDSVKKLNYARQFCFHNSLFINKSYYSFLHVKMVLLS